MTVNIDAMLRAAADAASANKKAEARALLERVIEIDERNEQAWAELSKVVDDLEEKRTCLENVLIINPSNRYARDMLARLNAGANLPPAAPSAPAFSVPEDDIFSGIAFDNQTDLGGWSDEPDPWATPTSSPSAIVDSYTPSIPDDWAANIVKKPASPALSEAFETGAFTDFDDDLFSTNQPTAATSADPFSSADPFDTINYETESVFNNHIFSASVGTDHSGTADPFTTFTDDDFSSEFNNSPFGGRIAEDEFDSFAAVRTPPPPQPALVVDEFEAQLDAPIKDNELDDLLVQAPARPPSQYQPLDDRSPAELFALIPASIPAGRVPGTDGSLPSGVKLLLGLAILMNVGAFAFLIARMMGLSPI